MSDSQTGEKVFLTDTSENVKSTHKNPKNDDGDASGGISKTDSGDVKIKKNRGSQFDAKGPYGGTLLIAKPKTIVKKKEAPGKIFTSAETGKISIMNFEDECQQDIPEFTEESTILAMAKLAVEAKSVKKITDEDLKEYAQFPEVKKKAEDLLENRRKALVLSIKEERENIIQKKLREANPHSTVDEAGAEKTQLQKEIEEKEIQRIENLQKREIVQLIVNELVREQAIIEEAERQARGETRVKEIEEENKRKNEVEIQKRKEKEQAMLQRIAEKEQKVIEIQKKQEEEWERNQRLIQEKKEKQLKAMADAEAARQKKAIVQRENLEKQLEEERLKVIERQKEEVKRSLVLEQRRKMQIDSIKEKNAKIFNNQREKFELGQKKQEELFEKKVKSLEKKELDSLLKVQEARRLMYQRSEKSRANSQILAKRHSSALERIKEEEKSKIEKISINNSKVEERHNEYMSKRLEKIKAERLNLLKKQEKIAATNLMKMEEMRKQEEKIMEDWDKDQKRAQDQKELKDKEIQQRMALQKLKDKIRDENAERVSKITEIKVKEMSDLSKEREERALLYVKARQMLAERKKLASVELQFKKESIQENFHELLRKGGKLDVDGLATKFDINVDELRGKVAESKNKAKTTKRPDNGSITYTGDPLDQSSEKSTNDDNSPTN